MVVTKKIVDAHQKAQTATKQVDSQAHGRKWSLLQTKTLLQAGTLVGGIFASIYFAGSPQSASIQSLLLTDGIQSSARNMTYIPPQCGLEPPKNMTLPAVTFKANNLAGGIKTNEDINFSWKHASSTITEEIDFARLNDRNFPQYIAIKNEKIYELVNQKGERWRDSFGIYQESIQYLNFEIFIKEAKSWNPEWEKEEPRPCMSVDSYLREQLEKEKPKYPVVSLENIRHELNVRDEELNDAEKQTLFDEAKTCFPFLAETFRKNHPKATDKEIALGLANWISQWTRLTNELGPGNFKFFWKNGPSWAKIEDQYRDKETKIVNYGAMIEGLGGSQPPKAFSSS